ncbi:MAG TPA: Fe-S protein assembly chaperone HscA [Alphaproteobacteria bacterium]|jgi:molecular chaperone HscA|nr:Fe-S protein assembly chaperone HscA [Alphaproteobacteria bacterium]
MVELLQIHEPGETPLPHAESNAAVGIDLGTTNSLVAVAADNRPEIITDAEGVGLVPSVVAYGADGATGVKGVVVGEAARRTLLDNPQNVVTSIKRLMGRGVEDIKSVAGILPYDIDSEAADGGMARLRVGERHLTPVEISADILRALKARAEQALGTAVDKAVITVPAYFDDAARAATKDAARLAGLEVLRLINEPTAAALAYGLDKGVEGLYAIYDLGGGTFDISLLRLEMGVFQVLATGGDAQLGGDDFDHAIVDHFLGQRSAGAAPRDASEARTALATARLAKECLSRTDTGSWRLEVAGSGSEHTLDVAVLESLIADLVERTVAICGEVLAEAGVAADAVKGVVLVGGSTRVPLVRRRVGEFFGRQPLDDINPDEVVALGAALQAEALTQGSETLLLDVTPLSLGIETMGDLVEKVIPRNTPIPVARAQDFTTYQDGQSAMMVHVVQGERELVDQCRSLARFELHGIPAMTAGAARIRVTFAVDADGLLTVSAQEETTGLAQEVAVKPSYGLDEEEMARMLRESMQFAQEDMLARMLREARVEGDRMLISLKSALESDGDLLSEAERAEVERHAEALSEAMTGEDRDVIHAAIAELNRASEAFAERRMDRGIRGALQGVAVEELDDGS